MTLSDITAPTGDRELRDELGSGALLAGDPGYDAARSPWNVAIDQRPLAIVRPETVEEVVDVVRAAAARGIRIAPQATGHAAGALAGTDLSDTVLMQLNGLRGVSVDPDARTARVLGGSLWNDVLEAAAPHGLTAPHGSAGDVGVVGYTLSGGLSFYARSVGLAVNHVRAVQIVTADGALLRASAEENPELFWAVRGGSGAFGVVVSIEIDLLPYADVFAGMLLWDGSHTDDVSHAWAAWTRTAPETATTTLRVMHFPPLPELPPFLSGRSVVVVDGAIVEDDATAAALLEPLRALRPELDTFSRIPSAALIGVHMDPPGPTPAVTDHAILSALPAEAVDVFASVGWTPGVSIAELRHLGGAVGRRPQDAGAVGSIAGDYLVHTIAMTPVPEAIQPGIAAVRGGVSAFAPWHVDALALTFVDAGDVDRGRGFGASAAQLRALKDQYDPQGTFAASQPV
ncbi:FAD-binding oxidoreductase [Microbacterium sp.]|uniref:FAD-binding oxidoreductase n=1 Tax=Microbacterium sp. TaxID=51671 RepID=UPI0028127590|nr:FAD-binding oxidoreductase [Microbacterium sp.]